MVHLLLPQPLGELCHTCILPVVKNTQNKYVCVRICAQSFS